MRWNVLWRKGAGTRDDPNNGRLILRITGINAYLYCRRSDSWKATLRSMYWQLVRRYPTELCQHCGRPVRVVFHAPDEIWELATGLARSLSGQSAGGVLCPPCVDELAEPKIDGGYLTWTCEITR